VLFLLFQLGSDRYALEANEVVEVLPLVETKRIPRAPTGVAGAFDLRGSPVPVIDLSQMALDRPAQKRLSTRIILVRHPDGAGRQRLLGVIAEKVTETVSRERTDFVSPGVTSATARYLGPVASDERGLIQWVLVNELLTPALREVLFSEVAGR
jgi:chemotaxis-related protein WspB